MKYKNLGLGLAIIAGALIWKGISIMPVAIDTQKPTGEVSVEINYLAGKSDGNQIVFEIVLNTHSIDLDDIDFQKTVIMGKNGQTFSPLAVETSGSNHHRSAVLSFSRVGVPLKIVFLGTPEVGRQEFEFGELK